MPAIMRAIGLGGLRRLANRARVAAPDVAVDVTAVAGAGLVAYGAWLIYAPAGYLVAGLMMTAAAVLLKAR